jgi:hypothetical protein
MVSLQLFEITVHRSRLWEVGLLGLLGISKYDSPSSTRHTKASQFGLQV